MLPVRFESSADPSQNPTFTSWSIRRFLWVSKLWRALSILYTTDGKYCAVAADQWIWCWPCPKFQVGRVHLVANFAFCSGDNSSETQWKQMVGKAHPGHFVLHIQSLSFLRIPALIKSSHQDDPHFGLSISSSSYFKSCNFLDVLATWCLPGSRRLNPPTPASGLNLKVWHHEMRQLFLDSTEIDPKSTVRGLTPLFFDRRDILLHSTLNKCSIKVW